jgi:hypothetical protein
MMPERERGKERIYGTTAGTGRLEPQRSAKDNTEQQQG